MFYVKPNVIGADGLGPIDPDRRDRLPGQLWRAVPRNPYWRRLAMQGDVQLSEQAPDERDIEGYVEPISAVEPHPAEGVAEPVA